MSEWKEITIKDCLSYMVDNRGKTPKEIESNGHPLIEVNAVSPDSRCPNYSAIRKYVNDTIYNDWFRSGHPQIDDILIPTVGTLGSVSLMDRNDCCIAQNLVALRCDTNICNPEFLYYVLRDRNVRRRLLKLDIGGVQPSIKVPHLMQFKIAIPAISTQEKIASILSTLDDKIAVNRRICENLEAQAQALFKHWFIDFVPFKDGKFVESELGMIPEEWKVGTLGSIIIENDKSKIQVNQALQIGKYPFFTSSAKILRFDDYFVSGHNVFLNTGGVADVKFKIGKAAYSTDTWCIHGLDGYSDFLYLYLSRNVKMLNKQYFEGSALKHLQKKKLKDKQIIIPSTEAMERFNAFVGNILEMIELLKEENERLAISRDTLLPKLMSAQIKL